MVYGRYGKHCGVRVENAKSCQRFVRGNKTYNSNTYIIPFGAPLLHTDLSLVDDSDALEIRLLHSEFKTIYIYIVYKCEKTYLTKVASRRIFSSVLRPASLIVVSRCTDLSRNT